MSETTLMALEDVRAFIRLSRPHFLLGGVLLYAVGAASVGISDWMAYLVGQGMVTSTQITAQYVNEYADIEADRLVTNRTFFSGGSGVLSSGRLSPQVALRAAVAASVVALVLVIAIIPISALAAVLGLAALAVSWLYSMAPVRLLGTGWGEMAASLVVAVMVPLTGALIQPGSPGASLIWHVVALWALHLAMMLIFELPDLSTDRQADKRVLAVRVGPTAAMRLIASLYAVAAGVGSLAIASGVFGVAMWWVIGASVLAGLTALTTAAGGTHQVATASAVAAIVLYAAGVLITI